jgi:hypothetical protein
MTLTPRATRHSLAILCKPIVKLAPKWRAVPSSFDKEFHRIRTPRTGSCAPGRSSEEVIRRSGTHLW